MALVHDIIADMAERVETDPEYRRMTRVTENFLGEPIPMSLHRPLLPILSKSLVCLAIAGASVLIGCSSEVGSSPSNKKQVSEFIAKESETSQIVSGRRGQSAKGPQGPVNIKTKLFKPGADKPE